MRILKSRNVRFEGDWEYTIFIGSLQIRVGRSQVAVWRHLGDYQFKCYFEWLSRRAITTPPE